MPINLAFRNEDSRFAVKSATNSKVALYRIDGIHEKRFGNETTSAYFDLKQLICE